MLQMRLWMLGVLQLLRPSLRFGVMHHRLLLHVLEAVQLVLRKLDTPTIGHDDDVALVTRISGTRILCAVRECLLVHPAHSMVWCRDGLGSLRLHLCFNLRLLSAPHRFRLLKSGGNSGRRRLGLGVMPGALGRPGHIGRNSGAGRAVIDRGRSDGGSRSRHGDPRSHGGGRTLRLDRLWLGNLVRVPDLLTDEAFCVLKNAPPLNNVSAALPSFLTWKRYPRSFGCASQSSAFADLTSLFELFCHGELSPPPAVPSSTLILDGVSVCSFFVPKIESASPFTPS
jgi:hypothetical protein